MTVKNIRDVDMPTEELNLDHFRRARSGIAEAVYAPGKSPHQCACAVAGLLACASGGPVLLTRAAPLQVEAALEGSAGGVVTDCGVSQDGTPISLVSWRPASPRSGAVLVVAAGTSDLPVAREASATMQVYGHSSRVVADVGVAGIHRILAHTEALSRADVVIVVAGMEGALASVVAGLTKAVVIAVPSSVGYGCGLGGVTALLAMMSSCSPGVTVVGIDNGFGAACAAVRVLSSFAAQSESR